MITSSSIITQAIILCGGLGTRLRPAVPDLPKCLAPIAGKPFLHWMLSGLERQGITQVILAVGYGAEVVKGTIGSQFGNIELIYSFEEIPLGTGGALLKAFRKGEGERTFVLNGDTHFPVKFNELAKQHLDLNSDITIAAKYMEKPDRFGNLVVSGNRVQRFEPASPRDHGLINGGIYLLNSSVLLKPPIKLTEKFSFEQDFLAKTTELLKICTYTSPADFIDIGIPSDYNLVKEGLLF